MGNHYEKKLLKEMWFKMNLAREFENRVQWLFSMGLVHGTTHLGVGEEATAVGSILALQPQDYVFGTHRGHSQAISKGIDINHMMAEILAKANGVCKGKGGSMHIADPDIHYFGADGILGTSAVMCCGTALKIKKKKEENRISVVFFGDGSSNEGAVFEAFNLASVWNLPVLFICVNNTYGMSTPIAKVMKDTDISKRPFLLECLRNLLMEIMYLMFTIQFQKRGNMFFKMDRCWLLKIHIVFRVILKVTEIYIGPKKRLIRGKKSVRLNICVII